MGTDADCLLRPEWVLRVAREVDAFARSLVGARPESSRLERLFTSLPEPKGDLEQQFLDGLRRWLSLSHGPKRPQTRAERARHLIVHEYRKPWTLTDLARAVGCNRTTLQEEFQRLTGTTVHRFLVQRRVAVAAQLLEDSDLKASCVSLEVGYRSHSAFARHFKMIIGTTLTGYRKSRLCPPARRDHVSVERAHLLP